MITVFLMDAEGLQILTKKAKFGACIVLSTTKMQLKNKTINYCFSYNYASFNISF